MKKIGRIALAVVLAVGCLGIGYAAWTDTITISGTVNTGEVDLKIVKLSSTYVYKDLDTDGIVVVYEITEETGPVINTFGTVPANGLLVASAVATKTGDDAVTFTYNNLFPCVEFVCDVMLHYQGIPAKVNDITWTISDQVPAGWIDTLVADYDLVGYARIWDPETHQETDVVEEGYQLHECDYVWIYAVIHLPQDAPMNATGTVTATFEVVQWNEYPYP